jgi:hypothetical protein
MYEQMHFLEFVLAPKTSYIEMKEEIGQGCNFTFMNMSMSCSGVMPASLSLFTSSASKSEQRV